VCTLMYDSIRIYINALFKVSRLGLVLIICGLFIYSSCSAGSWTEYDLGFDQSRDVSIDVRWPPGEIPGASQGYFLQISGGDADYVYGHDLISLVEIDPGDGTGWHDITDYYFEHMTVAPITMATSSWMYTFAAPGKYYVYARATYYDGEVVTSTVMPTTITATGT
jgi:hypothetical protein